MIKLIVAIRFQSGQAKEACRKYWSERHAPRVLKLVGVKHYVQSHRVLGAQDIGNAPYDGVESLWFDDEATAKQALASPHMAALRADAGHFSDAAGTKRLLAQEVVMRDAPRKDGALKLVTFNHRKPGLSPQAFQDYWQNEHGVLVLHQFAALRRYIQNHALMSCYDSGAQPDFDGMLEAWLASFEALSAGEGTPENEVLRADEANFLDTARFWFMLVRDQTFR